LAGQAQEVEEVRVAKHQIGRHPILIAKRGQILFDQFVGLFGDRCPFEQQTVNLLPQGPRAPPFEAAHFRVELAFQPIVNRQKLAKVGPRQLCTQCVHNLLVGESLGEPDHVKQIPAIKPPAVLRRQLFRQCRNNLLAVARTLLVEYVLPNPLADVPVQTDQGRVHRAGGLLAGRLDQRTNVAQQALRRPYRRRRSRPGG
jgi:hypothetical protein